MMDVLTSILDTLRPFSPMLMPPLLIGSAVYAIWYFTSAKRYAPLTRDEAEILWKIHKQDTKCGARKWQVIRHGNIIIGFKCKCGYKHIQKRPII